MAKNRFAGMVLYTLLTLYAGHKLTPTIHQIEDRVVNWDKPIAARSHSRVHDLQPRYVVDNGRLKAVLYDPITHRKVEIQEDLYPPTLHMVRQTGKRFTNVAKKGLPSIIEKCFPLLENYWRENED
ncbi:MAG: hypothetical protein ACE5FT_00455 [Candidatus Nanoarchaeia archaeon]